MSVALFQRIVWSFKNIWSKIIGTPKEYLRFLHFEKCASSVEKIFLFISPDVQELLSMTIFFFPGV